MKKAVLGIFDRNKNIDFVIEELKAEGYATYDISSLMRNRLDQIEFVSDREGNITEGALSGAGAGAILGAFAGFVAGLIFPNPGAFFIGVPVSVFLGLTDIMASMLSGALTGVLTGGILGAVMGHLVSEDDAKLYQEQIQKDSIFLAVPIHEIDEEKVMKLLEQNGAIGVKTEDAEYITGQEKISYEEPYIWYPNHEISPFMVVGAKGGKSETKKAKRNIWLKK